MANMSGNVKRLEKSLSEKSTELEKLKGMYNRSSMYESDYNDLQGKYN